MTPLRRVHPDIADLLWPAVQAEGVYRVPVDDADDWDATEAGFSVAFLEAALRDPTELTGGFGSNDRSCEIQVCLSDYPPRYKIIH